jgi:hypothetical protein
MAKSKRARNCRKTAVVAGQIPGTKKWFQCCPGKTVPKCHIFDPIAAAKRGAAANKAQATKRARYLQKAQSEIRSGTSSSSGSGLLGLSGVRRRRR